jgi:hypothetical protein
VPQTYLQKVVRLSQLVSEAEKSYDQAIRAAAVRGAPKPVRHKCFISYHSNDIDGVTDFVEEFNDVFIPRVVGVSDSDHFKDPIDSKDEDYIKQQIRSKYMSDSTVTILYMGSCAWARKYVDWEIAATLRNDPVNRRAGLMAITPADRSTNQVQARFDDNWDGDKKYARYYYYPKTSSSLREWIEDAFQARTTRANLVVNTRKLRTYNSTC